jgi:hypothetical protein
MYSKYINFFFSFSPRIIFITVQIYASVDVMLKTSKFDEVKFRM